MKRLRLPVQILLAVLVNLLLLQFIHWSVFGRPPRIAEAVSFPQPVELVEMPVQPQAIRQTAEPQPRQPDSPARPPAPREDPAQQPDPPEIATADPPPPASGPPAPPADQDPAPGQLNEESGVPASRPAAASSQPASTETAMTPSPAARPPDAEPQRPVYRVPPVYPRRAKRAGLEGAVTVEFTINPDGSIKDPLIVKSKPPGIFDRAVLRSIRAWRFNPGEAEQRAVQEITFKLTGQ